MEQFNIITRVVNTCLITSTIITGGISIARFVSGVILPVGIALCGGTLLLSLVTVIAQKCFKVFTTKQEKYDTIKQLAHSKLYSIADIISQTMQNGEILSTEFHKKLQKIENYCNLKG